MNGSVTSTRNSRHFRLVYLGPGGQRYPSEWGNLVASIFHIVEVSGLLQLCVLASTQLPAVVQDLFLPPSLLLPSEEVFAFAFASRPSLTGTRSGASRDGGMWPCPDTAFNMYSVQFSLSSASSTFSLLSSSVYMIGYYTIYIGMKDGVSHLRYQDVLQSIGAVGIIHNGRRHLGCLWRTVLSLILLYRSSSGMAGRDVVHRHLWPGRSSEP